MLFVLSFVWPVAAIVFGLINVFFRLGYTFSYELKVQARMRFFPLIVTNLVSLIVTGVAACIYW